MIKGITETFIWIQTLFIRDDGERFLLGGGNYPFLQSQLHFNGDTIANDVVELQGTDGQRLAGQVRRASTQEFDGYVGAAMDTPNTAGKATEQLRIDFLNFFQVRHHYTVVYVDENGEAIQARIGYLVDAPEVKEIIHMSPQYHVALNFEDPNYYRYTEDDEGDEIYGNTFQLQPYITGIGGIVWDSVGATWSSTAGETGLIWEAGGSGLNYVINNGATAYPLITITGGVSVPIIENLTTGDKMTYNAAIAEDQTLSLDSEAQTADLGGLNVFNNISGDFITLAPGLNIIQYSAPSAAAANVAMLKWRTVIS